MSTNGQNNEGSVLLYGGLPMPMGHGHILHICAHIHTVGMNSRGWECRSARSILAETFWRIGIHC